MAKKKKNATKRLLIIIGVLVVLVIVAAVAAKALLGGGEQATEVEVEVAASRTLTQVVTASGRVQPEIEVIISPDVSGEIVALNVREGDHVAQGELLARIKPDFYDAQVEQAQASLMQSKASTAQRRAELLTAELEYNRQKTLFDSGAISDADIQASENRFETAKAGLEAYQRINQQAMQVPLDSASRGSSWPRPESSPRSMVPSHASMSNSASALSELPR